MTTNLEYSIAWITVPNQEVASSLSNVLLEGKLCACVNIIPGIQSKYHWKGEIQTDTELLLMIKTRTNLVQQIIECVKKNHPYEVPEVISVPIQAGNPAYLAWIGTSTERNE